MRRFLLDLAFAGACFAYGAWAWPRRQRIGRAARFTVTVVGDGPVVVDDVLNELRRRTERAARVVWP